MVLPSLISHALCLPTRITETQCSTRTLRTGGRSSVAGATAPLFCNEKERTAHATHGAFHPSFAGRRGATTTVPFPLTHTLIVLSDRSALATPACGHKPIAVCASCGRRGTLLACLIPLSFLERLLSPLQFANVAGVSPNQNQCSHGHAGRIISY
jgi:hypothetical protein